MLFSSCTRGPLYYLKNHYSSLRATSFKSLRSSHMGACATAINNTPVLTSKYFGFNLPQISPFSSNSSGNLRDQGSSTSTSGGSGSGLIKKEWKLRTDPDDVNATALDAEAINGTLLFDGKQDLTIKLQFCAGSVNALVSNQTIPCS